MSNVIPANFGGKLSNKFATVQIDNDLAAGVGSSYAIVKYKGKVWSIDYRGEQNNVMRPDGDGPANSIEVVILKASTVKSRIYYPSYTDGANTKPACWSTNGQTPDARAEQKQANACAVCPRAVRGSKVDENGQARGSECRENKRIAIVPLNDLHNEVYGGPMLLRIPAASLGDFAMFGTKLKAMGLPYCAVGVKIAFDPNQAYPKFIFQGVRHLTDEEADIILDMRDDMQVKRIIDEEQFDTPALPAPEVQFAGAASSKFIPVSDEEPAKPAPAAKKATPKTSAKPAPAPAPVIANDEGSTGTSIDDELDALLG